MDGALLITLIAILVFGPIITLLWWKIADQWANAENRRFRRTPPREAPTDRVVVKGFKPLADADRAGSQRSDEDRPAGSGPQH